MAEPVEEVPHPLAAQRHLRADRVAGTQAELGVERLAFVTIGRCPVMVARVTDSGIECLRIGERLAETDVDDDLGESGT